jgi:hypothetical protein
LLDRQREDNFSDMNFLIPLPSPAFASRVGHRGVLPLLVLALAVWLLAVPARVTAATASTGQKHSLTNGKTWTQLSAVEKAQAVCIVVAVVALPVAEIWFIVAGFQTSVPWGLFMLFIGGIRSLFMVLGFVSWVVQWLVWTRSLDMLRLQPMSWVMGIAVLYLAFGAGGITVFIFRHWKQARPPLTVLALAVVLVLAAVVLEFAK